MFLALKTARDLQPRARYSFARRLGDKKAAASRPNRKSAFYQLSEQVERSNRCFARNPAASAKCFYRVGGQAFFEPQRGGLAGPRARPGSKPARHERSPGGKHYHRTGRSHASPPSTNHMVKVARRDRSGASRKRFSKSEILEFYLNQVPYGHQRRGVVEAARFYFDRDPATLNVKESLALAVLVRAPSGLDPKQRQRSLERRLSKLAAHMRDKGLLSEAEYRGRSFGGL